MVLLILALYDTNVFFFDFFLVTVSGPSCGGFLGYPSGSFKTPYYPSDYPNNVDCVWEIQVRNNDQIRLTLQNFV